MDMVVAANREEEFRSTRRPALSGRLMSLFLGTFIAETRITML